jgi:branched-chain amino acid transport system ATP-binding protein
MLLRVTDLHAQYGRIPILNGVRLEVAPGEFVGILGHNGMGKTTLLKTLMGFVPARRGHIVFDGTDITREPPYARARRGIGYVPQGREIFPGLSVRDNLRMGFAGRGAEERIEEILETFPRLAPLLNRRGGALSGGEQQLLAIARCLAGTPKLIFFDEPTEGIQPSIIEELAAILRRLHRTQALTIVLVEQNLEFIAELSNRVLLIQKGTILRELQPGELLQADVLSEFVGVSLSDQAPAANDAAPPTPPVKSP